MSSSPRSYRSLALFSAFCFLLISKTMQFHLTPFPCREGVSQQSVRFDATRTWTIQLNPILGSPSARSNSQPQQHSCRTPADSLLQWSSSRAQACIMQLTSRVESCASIHLEIFSKLASLLTRIMFIQKDDLCPMPYSLLGFLRIRPRCCLVDWVFPVHK